VKKSLRERGRKGWGKEGGGGGVDEGVVRWAGRIWGREGGKVGRNKEASRIGKKVGGQENRGSKRGRGRE